jgi:hypothetical protein
MGMELGFSLQGNNIVHKYRCLRTKKKIIPIRDEAPEIWRKSREKEINYCCSTPNFVNKNQSIRKLGEICRTPLHRVSNK